MSLVFKLIIFAIFMGVCMGVAVILLVGICRVASVIQNLRREKGDSG